MFKILYICFVFPFMFLLNHTEKTDTYTEIEWVDKLEGDYSFKDNWDYNDFIFRNDIGQLVCDGICDPRCDKMRDDKGHILFDSLQIYYQLVDTVHISQTIECETNCYEWAGINTITAEKIDTNTIKAFTACNAATHSSLQLLISGNKFTANIELRSIINPDIEYFKCKGGSIKIDRNLWKKNILKAEFYFTFDDPHNPNHTLWWRGKIYTQISK